MGGTHEPMKIGGSKGPVYIKNTKAHPNTYIFFKEMTLKDIRKKKRNEKENTA